MGRAADVAEFLTRSGYGSVRAAGGGAVDQRQREGASCGRHAGLCQAGPHPPTLPDPASCTRPAHRCRRARARTRSSRGWSCRQRRARARARASRACACLRCAASAVGGGPSGRERRGTQRCRPPLAWPLLGTASPPNAPPCTAQVGPRLELEVVKVEEGLCDGRVLFHKYQQRSKAEVDAQQAEWDEREALRAERRRQQVRARAAQGRVGMAAASCRQRRPPGGSPMRSTSHPPTRPPCTGRERAAQAGGTQA